MSEIWLRANPKAVWPLLFLPTLLVVAGLAGMAWCVTCDAGAAFWLTSAAILVLGLAPLAVLLRWSRLPRLAYQEAQLLVYLDHAQPMRVPIEVVECFFRGTGETLLPGAKGDVVKTATIIVRLAEAAREWHARPSRPSLGVWADGYITLRGTWCEPITPELLRRLNARLVEVHREIAGPPPCGGGGSVCATVSPCSGAAAPGMQHDLQGDAGGCGS